MKPRTASPLAIRILLAAWALPRAEDGIPEHEWTSDAAMDAREHLKRLGLIEAGLCKVTPKGAAWIEGICSMPLPVEHVTWKLPETRK